MPTNFVIFIRDISTRKELLAFDTIDKLIAAKPAQVVVCDDDDFMMTSIEEEDDNAVRDDAQFDPGTGNKIVNKQFGGTKGRILVITFNSNANAAGAVARLKLRALADTIPVEPAYHKFGIVGVFHPKVIDFNVDPTNQFGYTINRPHKGYKSGAESLNLTLRLSLGGDHKLATG